MRPGLPVVLCRAGQGGVPGLPEHLWPLPRSSAADGALTAKAEFLSFAWQNHWVNTP